ncbi:MAG TPA: hypothetical protein VGB30_06555 [bacterium]|jgi:hypothetical protein
MKTQSFPLIELLLFIFGCGGGSTPNQPPDNNNDNKIAIGIISGPDAMDENTNAGFSVVATGDTGILYSWTVQPVTAGSFDTPGQSTVSFHSNSVQADLQATLRVTVNSDHDGPETLYK